MNREKLIKEFDRQELEILLNDLQGINEFTRFKDGAFKYELGKYQANLLVNCIKKQKEVIDKAIDKLESLRDFIRNESDYIVGASEIIVNITTIINILKELDKEVE